MYIGEIMPKEEIKIIRKSGKDYPQILKEIARAPKQLYVRGELPKNHDLNFAIVGTRTASEYGKLLAFKIAKELAELGFNIVSGLALGIDTQAHLGALEGRKTCLPCLPDRQAAGRTIAVLGSGTDDSSIYPRENFKLAKRIIDSGGAVISEYEPGIKAIHWTFPERNRIVSGLSKGVLVVEAPEKSGALITARLALEQNREVFAIPGSVFSRNSMGANNLIKSGAKVVSSIDDILEELNLTDLKKVSLRDISQREKKLTNEEKQIFNIISKEPTHIDKICEITKFPAGQVMSIVSVLEIAGIIKNINGKFTKI